ncbi:MAG: class I SAM-dependent methyltransferase [Methanoregulaceae archaeon]|nr:class I SAM-dependent methyltransferase [Methanoregulaceae archaeon]
MTLTSRRVKQCADLVRRCANGSRKSQWRRIFFVLVKDDRLYRQIIPGLPGPYGAGRDNPTIQHNVQLQHQGKTMKEVTTDNREWFQDWANEYDSTLGKVKRHHKMLDQVVRSSGIKRDDLVLDIGCGTGLLSLKFLDKAECDITAIDSSAEMLEIFQEKIKKCRLTGKIHCMQKSAEDMDFGPDKFDIVAATVSLHHVKSKEPVIRNIYGCLKSGGRFVIGEIDMDTTGKPDDPDRLLRILDYLTKELVLVMKEGGVQAFERMYDNGKKHILNDGEYCIGFGQWAELCRDAGFEKVEVNPVEGFEWFKVLVATK